MQQLLDTKGDKQREYAFYLNRRYSLSYHCLYKNEHKVYFDLLTTDTKLIKIGQYPSIADLEMPEMKRYKSILNSYYSEFKKAIGLFSHGIGVGAFVYLRRIIEFLIFEKYKQASDELKIDEKGFCIMKFNEKIKALEEYLPKVLVKNRNMYAIVSKGIHELGENECLKMFPQLRVGIELILDDILRDKERENKERELEKFVAREVGNN